MPENEKKESSQKPIEPQKTLPKKTTFASRIADKINEWANPTPSNKKPKNKTKESSSKTPENKPDEKKDDLAQYLDELIEMIKKFNAALKEKGLTLNLFSLAGKVVSGGAKLVGKTVTAPIKAAWNIGKKVAGFEPETQKTQETKPKQPAVPENNDKDLNKQAPAPNTDTKDTDTKMQQNAAVPQNKPASSTTGANPVEPIALEKPGDSMKEAPHNDALKVLDEKPPAAAPEPAEDKPKQEVKEEDDLQPK